MKLKLGHSSLAETSLGADCGVVSCLKISGSDHLVDQANRQFEEGNREEASRLLRLALQGVTSFLEEERNSGGDAGREPVAVTKL
jgi:hypothetical protein